MQIQNNPPYYRYTCDRCGSPDIVLEAAMTWDEDRQAFDLGDPYQDATCPHCGDIGWHWSYHEITPVPATKADSEDAIKNLAFAAVRDGLTGRALDGHNVQAVRCELDAIAVRAAGLSAYLSHRGAFTSFDEGDAAGEQAAASMRKRVRKLLGFALSLIDSLHPDGRTTLVRPFFGYPDFCGRDAGYPARPAQIPASVIHAPGSYLGY